MRRYSRANSGPPRGGPAAASQFADTPRSLSFSTETRDFVETLLVATRFLISCAQMTVLIAFLVTGLRPYSLIRVPSDGPPMLQLKLSQARQNWLLLMILAIVPIGLQHVLAGMRPLFFEVLLHPSIIWEQVFSIGTALRIVEIGTGAAVLLTATRTWRYAQTMRGMMLVVLLLVFLTASLPYLLAICEQEAYQRLGTIGFAFSFLRGAASDLPLVSLCLFALLGLDRKAIPPAVTSN